MNKFVVADISWRVTWSMLAFILLFTGDIRYFVGPLLVFGKCDKLFLKEVFYFFF